ncbi:MAG: PilW family protein [Motiliproteus sp.]
MTQAHRFRSQQGLSLVELMIALMISTFMMLGVFEIYLGSGSTDRLAHAFARVQENGRLSMDILTRNLRMTGYQGCIDPELVDMNIIANSPPTTDLTNLSIRGWKSGDSAWDVANRPDELDFITGVPTGSDIVSIQYVSPTGVEVLCQGNIQTCQAVNANVKIDSNSIGLTQFDVVVISDCVNADLFRITNMLKDTDDFVTLAHSSSTNTSNNLSKAYDEDAQVMTYRSFSYYVRDTGRDNSQGESIYALYQFNPLWNDGSSQIGRESELIEGVEQLQILYGQRRDDGNLRFVDATDGNLVFSQVEALRLAVLVSHSEPVLSDADDKTYKMLGSDVEPQGATTPDAEHPGDRRLRKLFTTTIYLRNRAS